MSRGKSKMPYVSLTLWLFSSSIDIKRWSLFLEKTKTQWVVGELGGALSSCHVGSSRLYRVSLVLASGGDS